MKILQLNKFISITGGSESVMSDISRLLIQHGHTVFNMGYHKEGKSYLQNIIDLGPERRSPLQWLADSKRVKLIINFVVEKDIGVIIFHNIYHHFPCFSLLLQVKAQTRAKCILFVHDPKPVCPNNMLFTHGKICEKCGGNRFYKCIIQRCKDNSFVKSVFVSMDSYYNSRIFDFYRFFDLIISPSTFLKNKLYEMGFKHSVHVVRNPVENETALIKNGSPSITHKIILFAGRLSEVKGVQNIIAIADLFKDIKFIIIGDGPYKNILVSKSRSLENIVFLGYKTRHEIFEYMSKSSYLILPAIWYENCPVVVLEAMSMGLPVLGSNLGGIPELVTEERGYLFDPFSDSSIRAAITRAFSMDAESYHALSEKCKAFSKTVSFDNYYKIFSRYAFSEKEGKEI